MLSLLVSMLFFDFNFVSAARPRDFGLSDGDTISATGSEDPDIYIINDSGYKRLFLNPAIFNFYGHLGGFAKVKTVSSNIRDAFPTSGLFRNCETNDERVYGVESTGEDTGVLRWVNTTGTQAVIDDPNFFQKIFCINNNEFNWYSKGSNYNSVNQIPSYSRNITGGTAKKLTESNVYTIEDDGTIISSGVPSDRGIVDNFINEAAVVNKFFKEYPTASDFYDFVVILTNFKSPNTGHFTHAKDLDLGISDYQPAYDLQHIYQLTGYGGQGKFKGYALIPDAYGTVDDNFYILVHELSHRWLFYFKNSGIIDANLAHYKNNANTITNEAGIAYGDPNGGGSLAPNSSVPGYCLSSGSPNKYRFTSLSLYLMGLVPPEKTIPIKYYETSDDWSDKGTPCTEKSFSVQNVISLAGQRNPGYSSSQKDFSVAYITLTHKGEKLSDAYVQKVNHIVNNFPTKWNEVTNYKSKINGRGTIR